MPKRILTFADKFDFLIKWYEEHNNTKISEQDIAQGTDLAYRSIHALRKGEKGNPQLATLQAICTHFDIGLSYFECTTPEECRNYLDGYVEEQALAEIARRAEGISPEGMKNILNMIDFVRRAEKLDK